MASEKDLSLDQTTAEDEAGGGKKKKLIIIIALVILIIAIGGGVAWFLLSGDDAEGDSAENAEDVVVEEVIKPAQYIKMKPRFIVNYNVGTRQRFLQASIEIMTRSQEVIDAVELHNPMIRNEIVRILSDQDFNALRLPEGRIALRDQLREQLITTLKNESNVDDVEAILFTDFVMQ